MSCQNFEEIKKNLELSKNLRKLEFCSVVIGPTGMTGPRGEIVPTGPTGAQGIQGETGPTGPSGTTPLSSNEEIVHASFFENEILVLWNLRILGLYLIHQNILNY